jgi:hypothetical protein
MTTTLDNAAAAEIRRLNDQLRTMHRGGRLSLTIGVQALLPDQQLALFRAIRAFDGFDQGNDPHGEHDFGAVDLAGEGKFFFKIDYYAPDMAHGSDDPSDPAKTVRVMTIMRADEY